MYTTSKHNSSSDRQGDKLQWDWDALDSSEAGLDHDSSSVPRTSFFNQRPAQISVDSFDTLSGTRKRSPSTFSSTPLKRVKTEHSPTPQWPPDAKTTVSGRATPFAPKRNAAPFVIDSDSEGGSDADSSPVNARGASPFRVSSHRSSNNRLRPALANKDDQRLASKRLRAQALERKFNAPSSSIVPARHHEDLSAPKDADRAPRSLEMHSNLVGPTGEDPTVEAHLPPLSSREQAAERSSKSDTKHFQHILPPESAARGRLVDTRPLESCQKHVSKAVNHIDVPKMTAEEAPLFGQGPVKFTHGGQKDDSNLLPSFKASSPRKRSHTRPKTSTLLRDNLQTRQDVHTSDKQQRRNSTGTEVNVDVPFPKPITAPSPSKPVLTSGSADARTSLAQPLPSSNFKLQEKLREAEEKRDRDQERAKAERDATFTRDRLARERRDKQEEERRQRLIEEGRKRRVAKEEAEAKARQEAENRRQLEHGLEASALQEQERKQKLDEENKVYLEQRKADEEAQQQERQRQQDKKQAAERAAREKKTFEEAQNRPSTPSDPQQSVPIDTPCAPARPISLAQLANDSTELRPRSLTSLAPDELDKLPARSGRPKALGEFTAGDAKLVLTRSRNFSWEETFIICRQAAGPGQGRAQETLRKRYRQLEKALREADIPRQLIDRFDKGDKEAGVEINRLIRGESGQGTPISRPEQDEAPEPLAPATARPRVAPEADAFPGHEAFASHKDVIAAEDAVNAKGHPTQGGKTLDANFYKYHARQLLLQSKPENDEESEAEDEDDDDTEFFEYVVCRQEIPRHLADDEGFDENDIEWTQIDTFNSVEEANGCATRDLFRLPPTDEGVQRVFPDPQESYSHDHDIDEHGMFHTRIKCSRGILNVAVIRNKYTRERDARKTGAVPTINKTLYAVKRRLTTKETDEALGREVQKVYEGDLDDTIYSDLEDANAAAIKHFVYATDTPTSANMDQRTKRCNRRILELKHPLLVDECFNSRGDNGDTDDDADNGFKVWVERKTLSGPRNL